MRRIVPRHPPPMGAAVGSGSVPRQRHCVWARAATRCLHGSHPIGRQSLRERGPQAAELVETYIAHAVGRRETDFWKWRTTPKRVAFLWTRRIRKPRSTPAASKATTAAVRPSMCSDHRTTWRALTES